MKNIFLIAALAASLSALTITFAAENNNTLSCAENSSFCYVLFDSPYPAELTGMKNNADVYLPDTQEYAKLRWLHEFALATVTKKADGSYDCYVTTAAADNLSCEGLIDDPAEFFASH